VPKFFRLNHKTYYIIPVVITAVFLWGSFANSSITVLGQFETNTPIPTEQPNDSIDSPGGNFFATNTPLGPTPTPTSTSTPTLTPTATATSTSTPTPTFTPSNTPTPTPTPNGPFIYPDGVNPLTGLPYPNAKAQARRNLIVKISNYPPVVRPQRGVNTADVVYEYEAEGGVTRFAAIYRSALPEEIGSVRSARLIDIELVEMYAALLAYSGTSEPIQQLLLNADFKFQLLSPSIGDGCENAGFCRDDTLGDEFAFEHTLFADPELLYETATRRNVNTGFRARGFAFSDIADSDGIPTNDVFINWFGQTDARWQYDETTQRYLRFTDSIPHLDRLDGEQLWADNLIIIEVPHERRPDLFPPGANYESLEIQIWDQGRAYVMREGNLYQGFWRRQNENDGSALQVIYGNNTPIMLKPGRTWVSVVRGLGDVTPSEQASDMVATATVLAQTPSPTPLNIDFGD